MYSKIAITYVVQGIDSIRRNSSSSAPNEAAQCNVLARALNSLIDTKNNLSFMNPHVGPFVQWIKVDDCVHPFGDSRGDAVDSVWTVDTNKKTVSLATKDGLRVAALPKDEDRLLSLSDFKPTKFHLSLEDDEPHPPGPYWEPEIDISLREEAFLKPILQDFGHVWRHVLRWRMNHTTFMKLAYATIWLLTMDFGLSELKRPESAFQNDANVSITELPPWKAPSEAIRRVGASWFVLAQDVQHGLDIARAHVRGNSAADEISQRAVTYVILTLRRVILCKAEANTLTWTKPAVLYGVDEVSEAAIDMLIWAAAPIPSYSPTALSILPVEIQDRIIYYAGASLVASALLGCKLSIGSRFSWIERGSKIGLLGKKKHRTAYSPIESRILFHGFKSGLAYQREQNYSSPVGPQLMRSGSDVQAVFHCRFFDARNLVY
ncbi:hypothetical protein NLG97_g6177 [Lecanicillium saksenae]|uniref:Uncharacterized protein n=1 Tax=Lecanicillium saksenae TaxID=468837 RepID=A0ACC1QQZ2_9HYPO|nr:hypothetical protein NLG97_g6177 [Lecanicillium saksenae]